MARRSDSSDMQFGFRRPSVSLDKMLVEENAELHWRFTVLVGPVVPNSSFM